MLREPPAVGTDDTEGGIHDGFELARDATAELATAVAVMRPTERLLSPWKLRIDPERRYIRKENPELVP